MRRRMAAALLAPLFLLAACSGSSSTSPTDSATTAATTAPTAAATATAADVAALAAVKVEGAAGAKPTLTFTQPFTVTAPVARIETPGTGAALTEGESLQINYVAVSGKDGTESGTNYGSVPETVKLGDTSLVPAMNEVLAGQKVGVRFLLAVPGSDGTTTVMAIEVVGAKVIPTRASGTAVTPPADLPKVTLAANGEPTLTKPTTTAPTSLVSQVLIKGTGAAVQSGQTITVNYSGWLWDGTEFDTSWKGSPLSTQIGAGKVIKGWDEGLVGQTVGSQVLLVIPPSLGYGDTAQGSIPAGSTLVFVVDILDAS